MGSSNIYIALNFLTENCIKKKQIISAPYNSISLVAFNVYFSLKRKIQRVHSNPISKYIRQQSTAKKPLHCPKAVSSTITSTKPLRVWAFQTF